MKNEALRYITEESTLEVGESTKIKLGFMSNVTLIYGGMPNKDVFTIAILSYSGYQGYGYNLYYPKDAKSIKVGNKVFRIMNVHLKNLRLFNNRICM